jgi:hypothetical protein
VNYDPYAPDKPPAEGRGPEQGEPRPWEIGEVVSLGWERFQANWPVLILSLAVMILAVAIDDVPRFLVWCGAVRPDSPPHVAIQVASRLVALVVDAFLQVGFLRIVLDAARERPVRCATLFSGGSRMWPMLWMNLLVGLALVGGFLLLIVPGVIIWLGTQLAPYYIVDANLGAVEAIKESWAATTGQRGHLFLLALAGAGLFLLGLLLLGVGLAATLPTFAVAQAIVFTRMSGRGVVVKHESLAPPPGWPLVD